VTLALAKRLTKDIREHAEEGYPNEVCGFLVGTTGPGAEDRAVTRIRRAPNTFDGSRRTRFNIHPRELMAVDDELEGSDQKVLGFYHSHPDYPAAPSQYDQEHAWPWYSYIVVSVLEGEARHVTSWRLRGDRSTFDEETVVAR
jgi:proteasome lid subunit RPN8/RPN11